MLLNADKVSAEGARFPQTAGAGALHPGDSQLAEHANTSPSVAFFFFFFKPALLVCSIYVWQLLITS